MKSISSPAPAPASKGKASFDLKHRLSAALNKVADRDTFRIGADELERIAESLSPDMVVPFLSCVADMDADQKPAVRRECLRAMGLLASHRGKLLAPSHLSRIAASVVRRLRDADTVVRDACVATCGVLARSVMNAADSSHGGCTGAFLVLMRPLLEALGEQNRCVQSGAALCLAKVIDESAEIPQSILPQLLARVIKLLKSPCFMAKPAAIDLLRSIVQGDGVSTGQTFSAALSSICDALKSSDWSTRKAASTALASIALGSGSFLGPFRDSCIKALEHAKFDKVRPVRDAIAHAIDCWKSIMCAHSPEPSDVGSSTKECLHVKYHEVGDANFSRLKYSDSKKVLNGPKLSDSLSSTYKRSPSHVKKISTSGAVSQHCKKLYDWPIEISLPKNIMIPTGNVGVDESGRRCNSIETGETDDVLKQDLIYSSDLVDEKVERSSLSDACAGRFARKDATAPYAYIEGCGSAKDSGVTSNSSVGSESCPNCSQEHISVESAVTEGTSCSLHGCCLNTLREVRLIRKQLHDIRMAQSCMLHTLKDFINNSNQSISMVELNVQKLEYVIDQTIGTAESLDHIPGSKLLNNQSTSLSPRMSTSIPKSSTNAKCMQPYALSMMGKESMGDNLSSNTRNHAVVSRDKLNGDRVIHKSRVLGAKNVPQDKRVPQDVGESFVDLQNVHGSQILACQLLSSGSLEAAFAEVLQSGDSTSAVKLMSKTGPVLEKLSSHTATRVLDVLVFMISDSRSISSALSWLLQVVDLTTRRQSRQLFISPRAQLEFGNAVKEAAGNADPTNRAILSEIAEKLTSLSSAVAGRKFSSIPCREKTIVPMA